MCQKEECKLIEIIEIKDGVKVVLHYNKYKEPIFIQYWDDNTDLDLSFHQDLKLAEIDLNIIHLD